MGLPKLTAERSLYMTQMAASAGVVLSQQTQIPFGSYLSTCFGCMSDENGTLTCACLDFNNTLGITSLDNAWYCTSDISNFDGNLYCQY